MICAVDDSAFILGSCHSCLDLLWIALEPTPSYFSRSHQSLNLASGDTDSLASWESSCRSPRLICPHLYEIGDRWNGEDILAMSILRCCVGSKDLDHVFSLPYARMSSRADVEDSLERPEFSDGWMHASALAIFPLLLHLAIF